MTTCDGSRGRWELLRLPKDLPRMAPLPGNKQEMAQRNEGLLGTTGQPLSRGLHLPVLPVVSKFPGIAIAAYQIYSEYQSDVFPLSLKVMDYIDGLRKKFLPCHMKKTLQAKAFWACAFPQNLTLLLS